MCYLLTFATLLIALAQNFLIFTFLLISPISFLPICVQGMDQVTMAEGQKKMKNLFKE